MVTLIKKTSDNRIQMLESRTCILKRLSEARKLKLHVQYLKIYHVHIHKTKGKVAGKCLLKRTPR